VARRVRRGFIWIPRPKDTVYTIEIDGVDVTNDAAVGSEWTRSIIGLESPCKITLIDSNGKYADSYVGGEIVELKLDFGAGTTSQWKGKLERPKKKFGNAYTLELIGSHYQSDLLDITVTEEYTGIITADAIYKDLIDTYLTGHTYTNVAASTTKPIIKWDNKPLWDCLLDLCDLSTFDAYLDSDLDHHFFARESVINTKDAIIWNDTLLEIENLGTDTVDVKNRIIVYGEDDAGLPIIYQTDDTTSQSTHGIKERIIKDTSINTYEQAKTLGDVELAGQKDTVTKGEVRSIILPDLSPGNMIWISNPVQKVHGQFRIVKYVHTLPIEQTKVIISKEKTIPQIFKDRRKAELQLQTITNPNKMTNSYNFPFDNLSNIDTTISSGIEVEDGNLKISSGSVGIMVSTLRTTTSDMTYVHLKVVGEALSTVEYYISTDNGDTYKKVNLETKTSVTSNHLLRVKVILKSTSTRIDSLAVLYI